MARLGARIARLGHTLFAIAGTTVLACTATGADAVASTGIAYDTVLEVTASPNPPPRAGDVRADLRAGLTPNAFCMPEVVRRYMTPDRERIDDMCKQDATIVDCVSRTVTVLDLKDKQYSRISLDFVYDDGIAAMRALSDKVGSTSTLVVERGSNGTRVIDGVATEEYPTVRTQTVASPDLSITTRDSWTYDFLPDPLPTLACIGPAAAWLSRYGSPQRYAPELQAFWDDRERAMAGPRDRITQTGPPLPDWRIPLHAAGVSDQRQSNAPAWTRYFEIESGNIRKIQSDDPAFRVPADFTKIAR